MACESDQWILTYQLSRSHDQGGRKLPPQKFYKCNYVAYYQLEHKYSQTVQQSVESYQINYGQITVYGM
jgi:hypothetical protein